MCNRYISRLNCGTIHRSVIRRPHWLRVYNGAVAKCPWLRSGSNCWRAVVHGSPLLRIGAGSLFMLCLSSHRQNMLLVCHLFLLRRGTGADSTVAAVVADAVDRCGVVDHCRVVDVVNVGDIHVVHRTVVVELSVLPASALIAVTEISVSVTDAAIKTYLLTPVAVVENISVAAPTPIGRSPEQTGFRSHDPCARHPVVT